ncbi:hypothetical protein BKA70DRAFT_1556769, partial [Coprinopsis sp. MPI-PUGE-AT-0042]
MSDGQQSPPGVVLCDRTNGQSFSNSSLSAAGRDLINLSISLATGGTGYQCPPQVTDGAIPSTNTLVEGPGQSAQHPSLFTRVYRRLRRRSRRQPCTHGQALQDSALCPPEVTTQNGPSPGPPPPSPSRSTVVSDGASITSFDNCSQSSSFRTGASSEEEVYERCLLPKGHGYPMFNPRPLGKPAKIGDLGILGQDGFESFGNIYDPKDQQELSIGEPPEPWTTYQPEKFQEGQIISTGIDDARQSTSVNQDNVTNVFEFRCRKAQGAVLALTSSGELETLTPQSRIQLRGYLRKYGSQLMENLRRKDYLEPGQSLYVVTGTIKSDSWAIAVHTSPMQAPYDQVVLTRREDKSGTSFPTHGWTSQGGADARCGASTSLDEESGRMKDQCLFLRGFLLTPSVKPEQSPTPDLESNSSSPRDSGSSPDSRDPQGPNHLNRGSGSEGEGEDPPANDGGAASGTSPQYQLQRSLQGSSLVQPFPVHIPTGKRYYPSQCINDRLLEDTTVDLALTHDDDWGHHIRDNYLDDEALSNLLADFGRQNLSAVGHGVASTVRLTPCTQSHQRGDGYSLNRKDPTSWEGQQLESEISRPSAPKSVLGLNMACLAGIMQCLVEAQLSTEKFTKQVAEMERLLEEFISSLPHTPRACQVGEQTNESVPLVFCIDALDEYDDSLPNRALVSKQRALTDGEDWHQGMGYSHPLARGQRLSSPHETHPVLVPALLWDVRSPRPASHWLMDVDPTRLATHVFDNNMGRVRKIDLRLLVHGSRILAGPFQTEMGQVPNITLTGGLSESRAHCDHTSYTAQMTVDSSPLPRHAPITTPLYVSLASLRHPSGVAHAVGSHS